MTRVAQDGDIMGTLQTLDRGIESLFVVAAHPEGISIAELAGELGVPRATAYRIAATLTGRGLFHRGADGAIRLGAALPALAGQYWPGFLATVEPVLQQLADELGATGFVSVAEREDCVVLMTTEPAAPILRVGYRAGGRHPLSLGAAGIAILSARVPTGAESADVVEARHLGYAVTRGQLQSGAVGVAAPIPRLKGPLALPEASIGIVAMSGFDVESAAPLVVRSAASIAHITAEG